MISPHERVACTDEMSPAAVPSRGYPDFARLLGPSAWFRLPAAIRARFPSRHRIGHAVEYAGAMRVRASRFGRLLACLARVFDTPVAPFVGENVDTVVKVYPRPEVEGVVWERTYRFPRRGPAIVRSTKCLGPDGRLIEALGRGLRMQLEVFEDRGALRFVSTGYWIELFGLVVRLPSWLPPGVTHVIHTDEGGGWFTFTMYTEHPWFGEMFFQEGTFRQLDRNSECVVCLQCS